jgi:hypothetical protein
MGQKGPLLSHYHYSENVDMTDDLKKLPSTWKEHLYRTIAAFRKAHVLAGKIKEKPVRDKAINNIDNYLVELERLTFKPEPCLSC